MLPNRIFTNSSQLFTTRSTDEKARIDFWYFSSTGFRGLF